MNVENHIILWTKVLIFQGVNPIFDVGSLSKCLKAVRKHRKKKGGGLLYKGIWWLYRTGTILRQGIS